MHWLCVSVSAALAQTLMITFLQFLHFHFGSQWFQYHHGCVCYTRAVHKSRYICTVDANFMHMRLSQETVCLKRRCAYLVTISVRELVPD